MSHLLLLQAGSPYLGDFVAVFWPVIVPALLGLVAVYLLLPRVRRFPPVWGATLGCVALVLAGWLLIRAAAVLPETILFYAFSGVALAAGVMLVTHHNPVYAALSFALVVLSTCGLFLLLAAPFLMAATVIIYAGAIIVTFLFVIMLAQQVGLSSADVRSREPLFASLAGFILLGAIVCVLQRSYNAPALDPYLERVQQLVAATSEADVQHAVGKDPTDFFKNFRDAAVRDPLHPDVPPPDPLPHSAAEIVRAIDGLQLAVTKRPLQPAEVNAAVKQVHEAVEGRGRPLLSEDNNSPFSAPYVAPNGQGRPPERLPAENVAALGRSLFTDYLLAVELAGTLLLVATIGAIAIAGRRAEGFR